MKKIIIIILTLLTLTGCKNFKDDIFMEGYIKNDEVKVKTTCRALKNVLVYKNDYFITNDGTIYLLSNKKFSETNENCKKYDTNFKPAKILNFSGVDVIFIVSTNNKIYEITNVYDNEIKFREKEYNDIPDYLFNDDVKYAYTGAYIAVSDIIMDFLVLKNDGKLYRVNIERTYTSEEGFYRYNIINNELFKDFGEEKIQRFDTSYILTDKNVYIKSITNKECLEYADIKCNYDFVKNDYLRQYMNSLVYVGFDTESNDSYTVRTIDKEITFIQK